MKLLDHSNPADHVLLGVINDDWPFQFLSEFSRFHMHYFNEKIKIVYDEVSKAYMPIRLLNVKFFSPAQILFAPFRDAKEISSNEQTEFFNRLIQMLQKNESFERLVQPHPYGILSAYPQGAEYCEFGTYIVDLENQSEEQLLEKFHPKYQKAVAHSVNNGAIVKIGKETLPDFYKTYSSTMKKGGLHLDKFEYFKTVSNFMGDDHICSAVVYDNNEPVSGIFLLYSKYSAFLTHAGTQGDSKLYGAAKLLNFEVMKYLKNKHVKRYDFVGVRLKNNNPALDGIFRFKKGFGGDLKEGYLWKKDILPLKAKAYDLISKIKSGRNQIVDIIDQVNKD
ncbi:MAG: peptidoglycan bridge formation glycyltransferase FemA/FemB family protein [Bacteroidetes bacterium]|nr:peptidoglycan bridge formation glycyltransferase FemA/FemB family protein [Bacteroidota bacterium]